MIHGLVPRLAEGGKIKIGGLGEVRQGKGGVKFRLPKKYDQFVVTTTERGPDVDGVRGDLLPDEDLMMSLLETDDDGQVLPLREIPIVVHSDDVEEVFPTTYAIYSGRRLHCKGNGKVAHRYTFEGRKRSKDPYEVACPCDWLKREHEPCKAHGILHCAIRVPGQAVAGSLYTWRTTSTISIQQMVGSLNHILATCGVLQGLPLVLCLRRKEVAPQGQPTFAWVCHIELRAKDVQAVQQQALEMAQLRNTVATQIHEARQTYRAMIQEPGEEDVDEQAEVQQEFMPEEREAQQALPLDAPDEYPRTRAEQLKRKLGAKDE
jgi:hypothetical protein